MAHRYEAIQDSRGWWAVRVPDIPWRDIRPEQEERLAGPYPSETEARLAIDRIQFGLTGQGGGCGDKH